MNTHETTKPVVAPPQAMELFEKELRSLEKANPNGITTGQICRLADMVTTKYNEFIQRHYCTTSSS